MKLVKLKPNKFNHELMIIDSISLNVKKRFYDISFSNKYRSSKVLYYIWKLATIVSY